MSRNRAGIIVATAAAWLSATPSYGDGFWKTGNTLYLDCQNAKWTVATYLMGVDDGIEQTAPNASYCLPSSIVGGQIVDVFCAYLQNHPDTRHYIAPYLARLAFTQAWPCP